LKIIGHGNPDNNLESPCNTMGIYCMQMELYMRESRSVKVILFYLITGVGITEKR
jgi:hypothetical protein